MPPKKEFYKLIANEAEFEPYMEENYSKLLLIDLYVQWAGPCEAMKDFWKFLNNTTLIEDFDKRCDILQVEKKKSHHFDSYDIKSRPKFLLVKAGRVIQEVNGPNCPMLLKTIMKYLPKTD